VNHITTVKVTSVIRNAAMVVRNIYRLIERIGFYFHARWVLWPPRQAKIRLSFKKI
jgi:hypothetical protein